MDKQMASQANAIAALQTILDRRDGSDEELLQLADDLETIFGNETIVFTHQPDVAADELRRWMAWDMAISNINRLRQWVKMRRNLPTRPRSISLAVNMELLRDLGETLDVLKHRSQAAFSAAILTAANELPDRPPYESMGHGPSGFNCVGLVACLYKSAGHSIDDLIPTYTAADETPFRAKGLIEPALKDFFSTVPESDWKTGDVVLMSCYGGVHLGILIEKKVWTMTTEGLKRLPLIGCRASVLSVHRRNGL